MKETFILLCLEDRDSRHLGPFRSWWPGISFLCLRKHIEEGIFRRLWTRFYYFGKNEDTILLFPSNEDMILMFQEVNIHVKENDWTDHEIT